MTLMNIYLLSGARTPCGSFLGALSSVSAPALGAVAIEAALKKAGLETQTVDEVFMGQVLQAGSGQAPARQAALGAGLPDSTPCSTVNKVCGSGMQAAIEGIRSIKAGDNQLVVTGGMENMSLAPHLLSGYRRGLKFGAGEVQDSMQRDGLQDAYTARAMGDCAEECVNRYSFTREQQDAFAIESFKRAQRATNEGIFATEIAPVTLSGRKGDVIVEQDEGPFKAQFDKIPKLSPAFVKNGTITAANASSINDGASAVVVAGEKYRDKAQFRVVAYAASAADPVWFTTAPISAMKKCAERANLAFGDIDLFEINEAFAAVPMAAIKSLELDVEKVNIYGGGIALGHPIGSSGCRILVTLMTAMKNNQSRYGMASLCIGGGEALAMILERL